MAAIAGKVAITPKGEWSVDVQYEKLDFVLHGSDSYVARKPSMGIEPGTDSETWQLSLRGATSEDINNLADLIADIIDGTKQVGKAVSSEKADTADKLSSERSIELTGDAAGSASFNGSEDVSIEVTVADNSHKHSAGNITAGTLAGKVVANATAVATLGNKQVRNIYAGTDSMTSGTTALPTGDIYIKYK